MNTMFKIMGAIHTALYKLTRGRIGGTMNGADVLLLMTTGRKSGKDFTNPVMYVKDGEDYLVVASAGGSDKNPGWYWNAISEVEPVKIQVEDRVMTVAVSEVKGDERNRLYQRFVNMMSGFGDYEKRTERTIPILRLSPEL